MSFTTRQLAMSALVFNALKPLGGWFGPASFAAGWPTGEMAGQLAGLTLADAAQATLRGKSTKLGLALAAGNVAGLAVLVKEANQTGDLVAEVLKDTVGDFEPRPARFGQLLNPFRMIEPDVTVERSVRYHEIGSRSLLDIYRSEATPESGAPVLLQIHGGAWTIGSKEQQGLMLMNEMAHRGWVCVAANYRLAPKHRFPKQIIDVKRAIAWVRENIAEYGGDPNHIVITGGSAGGHLSSLAALTPGLAEYQPDFPDADTSVAACVPFYGVYDMAGVSGDRYTTDLRDRFLARRVFDADPRTDLAAYELASPISHVNPDAPDFFVIHGTKDGLVAVQQARDFVERLQAVSKSTVSYLELPRAQHAFEVFSSIRSRVVIGGVADWLQWQRTQAAHA